MSIVIVNGVSYKQIDTGVQESLNKGKIPPPNKDARKTRLLGPYHNEIVALNKAGLTAKAIYTVMKNRVKGNISYAMVRNYLVLAKCKLPTPMYYRHKDGCYYKYEYYGATGHFDGQFKKAWCTVKK